MRFDREKLREKIEKYLYDYVGIQSDTGTVYERNIEKFYEKYFEDIPYFKANPQYRGIFPIPKDHLNRHVPWALLKGEGDETIVLLHHSDTVDTADYLHLRELALKPKELEQAMREGKIFMPEDAKKDIDSGDWLFGRGVNDMKGGASVHIAMFEEYTKIEGFKGNLLLIAAPDEENLSAGAIGASYLLNDLMDKFGLEYKLCLLCEPDTNSEQRNLCDGSIGKIMPLIYVRGKLAHVGKVYDGLNPIKLLAKIVDYLDLNPEFIETNERATTPAPTFLYAKDHKNIYDVSLPAAASGFMSFYCFHRVPKESLELIRKACENAMKEVISSIEHSFAEFLRISNTKKEPLRWAVNVKLYGEVYDEALLMGGDKFLAAIHKVKDEVKRKVKSGQMTPIEASHEIIEGTLAFTGDMLPTVIITLVPPYYPYVSNEKLQGNGEFIDSIGDMLIKYAKEENNHDYRKIYMTGMCDFSYMMQTDDKETNDYIENNMLMWGDGYYIPFEKIRRISMPVLNVGPLGRGIHQYTERVFKPDVFYTIPDYTDFVIRKTLNHE
ncbi:MAG: M20/M25/M40 family metallo-hydrolase [Defluviitaleaceae bacterium]|nr:M20/M25/M40 family metallo-hydrolase [Defluviitaleaceae bacterium]